MAAKNPIDDKFLHDFINARAYGVQKTHERRALEFVAAERAKLDKLEAMVRETLEARRKQLQTLHDDATVECMCTVNAVIGQLYYPKDQSVPTTTSTIKERVAKLDQELTGLEDARFGKSTPESRQLERLENAYKEQERWEMEAARFESLPLLQQISEQRAAQHFR